MKTDKDNPTIQKVLYKTKQKNNMKNVNNKRLKNTNGTKQ